MHHDSMSGGEREIEDPIAIAWNRRLGLFLFVIYATLYTSFVLANAFAPGWMSGRLVAGVSNAVMSGFALIFSAIVIAFAYGLFCKSSRGANNMSDHSATEERADSELGLSSTTGPNA